MFRPAIVKPHQIAAISAVRIASGYDSALVPLKTRLRSLIRTLAALSGLICNGEGRML